MVSEPAVLHYGRRSLVSDLHWCKEQITTWRTAFRDFHFTIEDVLAEGAKVVLRLTFTGTQHGTLWDIPPTGRQICVMEIIMYRIVEGRIVEGWEEYDELGMRQQLGVISTFGQGSSLSDAHPT